MEKYDLIVIGSGPAGQKAALQGAKAEKKVAIIEAYSELGGGCIHFGTLPSKSFRESVYRWSLGSARDSMANSMESVGETRKADLPNMERLLKRRNRVVKAEGDVIMKQLHRNGITIYHGRGRLVSPNEVEVYAQSESAQKHKTLFADFIVIAVGTKPISPPHLAVDGKFIHDSNTILSLNKLPRKMVVLGAGVIGCEYASMFSTAGTAVCLVDKRYEILASVDREIVSHLIQRFDEQGMEILLEVEAVRVESCSGSDFPICVYLSNGKRIKTEVVLVAQGRYGNIDGLGLEKIGIECVERGLIAVDNYFRTKVPNIYAVGDVVGPPALASTSMEEGRIAACHAFHIQEPPMSQFFPFGIYTIPEISILGPSEEDLLQKKIPYVVGKAHYRELARGQIVGDRFGLLKILVDKTDLKLLGLHIVGDSAADLIHVGQAVMAFGGNVQYFIHNIFNYPTFAEAYKTAAFHAVNQINGKTTIK